MSGITRLIILVLVVIVLAVGAYVVIRQAEVSRSDLPALARLPEFEFVTHEGARFGTEDMLGEINVVDFIFTRCQGPCPIMGGHMSELYELFEDANNVRFISITVDPEYDSLSVLRAYADGMGVRDSRWLFLWAPIDSVVWLSESGFMLAAEDLPGSHTTKWALVDQNATIRGYYGGTDPASIEILKTHIVQLVRDMR